MKMIKSLFRQFSPETIILVPLQIISSLIAISWILLSFSTNFFPGQKIYIWKTLLNKITKLIFQKVKEKTAPWVTLLLAIFFLIFSIKIIGLLPYAFTITRHISFTYRIAIPLWLRVKILGFYLAFKSRLSHLVPQGTPWYLIPLMVWIETISLIAQPIALGLRLAAKLTAGHLLIFLLSTAAWILRDNIILRALTTIILILLFILEIAVACIQAYVFTSLIKFYIDQKI